MKGAFATRSPSGANKAQEKSSLSLMFVLIAVCCSDRPIASATLINRLAKSVKSIGSGPWDGFLVAMKYYRSAKLVFFLVVPANLYECFVRKSVPNWMIASLWIRIQRYSRWVEKGLMKDSPPSFRTSKVTISLRRSC